MKVVMGRQHQVQETVPEKLGLIRKDVHLLKGYLIIRLAVLPLHISSLPHLGVGVVHDGNQQIDHQYADGDLVDSPHGNPHEVGELMREWEITAILLYQNFLGVTIC